MIEHLQALADLTGFPGSANQTRCFAHILNLVAKGIMKQLDAPKGKKTGIEGALEDFAKDLETELDEDISESEAEPEGDEAPGNDLDASDEEVEDSDGQGEMSEEEISMLDESVKPVRLVLFKVC